MPHAPDWSQKFSRPIPLGDGRVFRTLKDAGELMLSVPKGRMTDQW